MHPFSHLRSPCRQISDECGNALEGDTKPFYSEMEYNGNVEGHVHEDRLQMDMYVCAPWGNYELEIEVKSTNGHTDGVPNEMNKVAWEVEYGGDEVGQSCISRWYTPHVYMYILLCMYFYSHLHRRMFKERAQTHHQSSSCLEVNTSKLTDDVSYLILVRVPFSCFFGFVCSLQYSCCLRSCYSRCSAFCLWLPVLSPDRRPCFSEPNRPDLPVPHLVRAD